ncbi:MAG: EAL domain-containing protein [Gammaproteobacteria bacterium]|nr:EAL domain-containing protein [Gammaproteobacteria bacterium]
MKKTTQRILLLALIATALSGIPVSLVAGHPPPGPENIPLPNQVPNIALDHTHSISWLDIWVQYSQLLVTGILALLVIGLLLWLLASRNRQLRESQQTLIDTLGEQDAIFAAIPELMFEMDMEGRYLNVWARNPDELSASRSLLLGRSVFQVMPLEQAEQVMQALQQADRQGQSHGYQIRLGEYAEEKNFELSVSLKSSNVSPHCFVVLSRDISAQIRSQKLLTASQERYQGLVESMAAGVSIFRAVDQGADFVLIDFNQAGEKIEQLRALDVIGKRLYEAFPHVRVYDFLALLQRVHSSGDAENFPMSFYQHGRLSGWRDYFIYRLPGSEVVAIFTDETERKLAEQNLDDSQSLKQLIIQAVPDLMWLKDVNGVFLSCNHEFERFYGATEAEIKDKTDYDFVDKKLADFFRNNDMAAMQADRPLINEEWIRYADDGHQVLLETTKVPLKTANGKILGVLGIGHDITERYRADEERRLAASVFTYSQEGILITDVENRIIDANPACLSLTGYAKTELSGQNPRVLNSGQQTEDYFRQMWETLGRDGHWQGVIVNRKKSGELYTERLSIDKVHNAAGELTHYVAVFADISYLKEQEQALEFVAFNDALTGLPNRVLLRDRIQQAISLNARDKKQLAVCYLDLDGFKAINDAHGHTAGDEVLIEVAARLKQVVRKADSVARLGGDEFVLLLLNLRGQSELDQTISRVLDEVARPCLLSSGEKVRVSASIGISVYPLDDAEPDSLLRHADQAMYRAKKQGKNRYCYFDPNEEQMANKIHHLHMEIESAINNNEFVLYYQPQVNMLSAEVVGAEALIRWNHPVRGLLSPIEFLPAIENNPLIVALGKWVLEQAMQQLQRWKQDAIQTKISVNIAALQLRQEDFVKSLSSLLDKYPDISPAQLELEILETAALHDIQHVSQIIRQCAELGILFALDDFGTGYSSLSYLKQLPAHTLKIDQSFIRNLLDDPDDMAIVEGILSLARVFGRSVIAEGVETVRHGSRLLNIGCELGQGYGIARPMPAADFAGWMRHFKQVPEWQNIRQKQVNDVTNAILMKAVEHHGFVTKVLNAMNANAAANLPPRLADAHSCQFGQWLDSEGAGLFRTPQDYQQMVADHARIHVLCQQIALQMEQGDVVSQQSTGRQLRELSHQILDSLHNMRVSDGTNPVI